MEHKGNKMIGILNKLIECMLINIRIYEVDNGIDANFY